MPCLELIQAAGENRIIHNVSVISVGCGEGHHELGRIP